MSQRFPSDKDSKKPTLRRSQTITVFGVGAIADLPDASVMICGIEKWDVRGAKPLSDPRLEKKLGVPFFYMPPDTDQSKDGIRAIRFPRWMRCRKCGALRSSKDWRQRALKSRPERDFDWRPFCDIDSVPLIPSRFVVACRLGHIDDFPYVEWVHRGGQCPNTNGPDLKYGESGKSASLAGINITCKACKASRSMRGAFNKQSLAETTGCKGSKPWAGKWEEGCGEQLTGLLRGGTNVHFPIVRSSILIPPFTSENLKTKIADTKTWQVYESQDGGLDKNTVATLVAGEIDEKVDAVLEAINEMENGSDDEGEERSEEEYRFDEYRAFLGDVHREKDFEIEPVSASDYDIPYLKSVVLVKKLREIRVQTGFSRIRPPHSADEEGEDEQESIQEVSVADDRSVRWRPAYEVRGEGIFLEFNADMISKWANDPAVKQRSKLLINRFNRHPDAFAAVEKLTPEFLLLHSLSHLLIRQLSFECGYGSSALRERIYCSSDQNKRKMAGILIYTADGDSDGTMGGLVRQGRPDYFPRTLYEAVTSARWCSSDPLCIESEGQGYQSMNLAACHACAMLPETSCESMNRYVDRAMVVGTIGNPQTGLLGEWADEVSKSH